jgi:hypothetical protein
MIAPGARQPDQLLCVLSDHGATELGWGVSMASSAALQMQLKLQLITSFSRRKEPDCLFIRSQHKHTTFAMVDAHPHVIVRWQLG